MGNMITMYHNMPNKQNPNSTLTKINHNSNPHNQKDTQPQTNISPWPKKYNYKTPQSPKINFILKVLAN
jgi:hypothetical protein